jgi:hypothetical protein
MWNCIVLSLSNVQTTHAQLPIYEKRWFNIVFYLAESTLCYLYPCHYSWMSGYCLLPFWPASVCLAHILPPLRIVWCAVSLEEPPIYSANYSSRPGLVTFPRPRISLWIHFLFCLNVAKGGWKNGRIVLYELRLIFTILNWFIRAFLVFDNAIWALFQLCLNRIIISGRII